VIWVARFQYRLVAGVFAGATCLVACSGGGSGSPSPQHVATPTPTAAPTVTASATPGATATPTPTVTPALAASPSTVDVNGTGAGYAQTITATEPNYGGAISESDNCDPGSGQIAAIAPASGSGPVFAVTVTGVTTGSCLATFTDTHGQTSSSTIIVTTSGFTVE